MSQYFLVYRGNQTIRLDKGFSEEKVDELLGDVYEIENVKNETDQKRVYQFKSHDHSNKVYKLLLRGGVLEWIMRSSQ